jgi:hypothetical protein
VQRTKNASPTDSTCPSCNGMHNPAGHIQQLRSHSA